MTRRINVLAGRATLIRWHGHDLRLQDNLTSITDALGRSNGFAYDNMGRVIQTTFPSTLTETYAYDDVGNLTSKTDRKGQTISYTYDALNRLTRKQYPDTTGVDYGYDLVGRLLTVSDPTGSYAFNYEIIFSGVRIAGGRSETQGIPAGSPWCATAPWTRYARLHKRESR